eukprot:TRINITY_DN886_c0_g1_i1.p1 TRINITY_DN886_c0_g1~~TRINITY_DN886_c0_g1_i1.p1  ORF type:complete len:357 (+),score=58.94 TRINITY_DN886_c0_g1_i1:426-1496(+)
MSNRHIKNTILGVFVLWICLPSVLSIQLSGATLYQARGELIGITAGDIAIFAGGDSVSFDVDMFSESTQNWTYAGLGISVRPSVVAVGPCALVAGGSFADNTVHLFNSTSLEWSQLALSSERHSLAATSVGSLAMFGGGISSDNIISNLIDVFDIESESWSTKHLSANRFKLAAASAGPYALFAGGETFEGPSDVVDIYNANTNSWSVATLTQARSSLVATSVGKYILFAGGDAGHVEYSNVVDIFDSETGTWTNATLSLGRSFLGATSVGRFAVFGGGQVRFSDPKQVFVSVTDRVDIFDAQSQQWSTYMLSFGRSHLAATTLGNQVFFAGGQAESNGFKFPFNAVDILDFTEDL